MTARVTEQGLLIPKDLLEGFDEVEVRREDHQLLILPVSEDPILHLGREPAFDRHFLQAGLRTEP